MKKTGHALLLVIFVNLVCTGQIINIPGDQPSIQAGIDVADNGDTVLVQPGIYVENIDFSGKDITVASLFLTTQDTTQISQTIIDGDAAGSVVAFENDETNSAIITGFKIQNGYAENGGGIYCFGSDPTINNNIIQGNHAYATGGFHSQGGGVYCNYSDAIICDNIITNNYASGALGGDGGGIYCGYSNPVIRRILIKNNLGGWGGGGIYCKNSSPLIVQNTIVYNTGSSSGGALYLDFSHPILINNTLSRNSADWWKGGGIYNGNQSSPEVINTILYQNEALLEGNEIWGENGSPVFSYCNIAGGWAGTGNIDSWPYFRDPDNNDFHLKSMEYGYSENSPCIDTGDPSLQDAVLDSLWGLGTILCDMGAYGGVDSIMVGLCNNSNQFRGIGRIQIYPNPSLHYFSINFELKKDSFVTIEIYDYHGNLVKVLLDEYHLKGPHNVVLDLSSLIPGTYFCFINTAEGNYSQKLIKL